MYDMRIRYANNIITFYQYSKPLASSFSLVEYIKNRLIELKYKNYHMIDFEKLKAHLKNTHDKASQIDKFLNMSDKHLINYANFFLSNEQGQINIFDYIDNDNKANEYKVLKANFNAKKDAFIDLVSANLVGNCFFVTLTYNENFVLKLENDNDIDNIEKSHKRFRKFIERVSYHYYKDRYALKYAATWELQKEENEQNNFTARMAIHYHIDFFDMPTKKLDLDMLREKWSLDGNSLGIVNVKKINTFTTGVAKYQAKYLLKDFADMVNSKKSYFSSKNLIRPYNDMVIKKDGNLLYTASGEIIDLSGYGIESEIEYNTVFNGLTKKITYNRG